MIGYRPSYWIILSHMVPTRLKVLHIYYNIQPEDYRTLITKHDCDRAEWHWVKMPLRKKKIQLEQLTRGSIISRNIIPIIWIKWNFLKFHLHDINLHAKCLWLKSLVRDWLVDLSFQDSRFPSMHVYLGIVGRDFFGSERLTENYTDMILYLVSDQQLRRYPGTCKFGCRLQLK